jgi:hypothetical protein
MIVSVTPNVRLRYDAGNWILETRQIIQSGKMAGQERWNGEGYHGTLKQAACALYRRHVDLVIPPVETTSLRDLITAIDAGADRIVAAVERGAVRAEPATAQAAPTFAERFVSDPGRIVTEDDGEAA